MSHMEEKKISIFIKKKKKENAQREKVITYGAKLMEFTGAPDIFFPRIRIWYSNNASLGSFFTVMFFFFQDLEGGGFRGSGEWEEDVRGVGVKKIFWR